MAAGLRAFCDASPKVQAAVLRLHGNNEEATETAASSSIGSAPPNAISYSTKLQSEITREVALFISVAHMHVHMHAFTQLSRIDPQLRPSCVLYRCTSLPWRVASGVMDKTLVRVCHVFVLNSYSFGEDHAGLFELGSQFNHSCDSNMRYSRTERVGRGSFIARRDITVGESLTTNYIGEWSARMSTPARREQLLSSKLFTCRCVKCQSKLDPGRHVPCPGCMLPRFPSNHVVLLHSHMKLLHAHCTRTSTPTLTLFLMLIPPSTPPSPSHSHSHS